MKVGILCIKCYLMEMQGYSLWIIIKRQFFVFVGEFENYSISWSQANVEEYEKEFTPRHLLEWNVIKFYKEIGFDFYDIGEIYIDYCDYSFSDKEKKIFQILK